MNYSEFLNKIKSNSLDPSYLFIGGEEYLMNNSIDILKNKYIKSFEELNLVNIKGKDADLEVLINACETLPFMSEKKLIILRDLDKFLDDFNGNNEDDLYDYLDTLEDFLCLILIDNNNSIKKNRKIYKYFNKRKTAVEFSKLVGKDLNNWITSILKKHKKEMDFSTMNYFIEKSSYTSRNIDLNLFDLENELIKIIDYSENNIIEKEDIDKVLIKSIDTNIFEMLDAISTSNCGKALKSFNELYMSNEPIQRIFYMITRQIRLLLSYKLYKEKGYNNPQIQEKIKISPYEFKKISSQSIRWTVEDLEEVMEELLNIDIQIKTTSSNDKLLVEMLLVKLCNNE